MTQSFLTHSPVLTTAPTNDETANDRRRIDAATRDEVVSHTLSHFFPVSLYPQSRDNPPVPTSNPDNEPNGAVPPSLTLSAEGFVSLRLHPSSPALVGGGPFRGSCISYSSLEGSGPCVNDPAPRSIVARPATIVHSSQHFGPCTRSPDFTYSASDENSSPRMLLEPSSPDVGDVPGVMHLQEIAGPFAFTPFQLASLLDSKDLGALEAIGGVENLLRGLGTHPTHGLRAPDCGGGYPCNQRPSHHAGDRRDPYNATLQERRQVFGENSFPPRVKKSWLMDKALHYWTKIRVGDGFFNGRNSQFRALDKVKGVQVVRDGVAHNISLGEVVVGDIALLAPGEIIPCDGIFLSGYNVTCDESATTGETAVVKKAPFSQCVALKQAHPQCVVDVNNGSAPRSTCKHHTDCFIVSGSKVLVGFGRYVVTAVGTKSRIIMAHGASRSNKSFKRFFTRLCRVPHPKVLPTVLSVAERNPSIALHYESIVAPTLRGCCNISVSSLATHAPYFDPQEDGPMGSTALLRVCTSQSHPKNNHFDNNEAHRQPELGDLAKQASRYCSNLGDRVHRDIANFVTGGYAFVYRGTLDPEGTAVAVKTSRFGHKSDAGVIKSFCREVHIWSKLRHNNVLPVLGFTTEFDQTMSIVSPWMERGNAHVYVQNVGVDPRPLLVGIATGLQYLHSCEVYHGDLKGLNVLISNDGCPLLTDFGFAFIANSSFSMDVESSKGGSPYWMAPECFGPGEDSTTAEGNAWAVTAERDVWAFGMTTLELFTRQRPFPEVNIPFQLIPLVRMGHPRPSDEATYFRLTDEWWNICLLCWHLDPLKRPRMSDILAKISMSSSHG